MNVRKLLFVMLFTVILGGFVVVSGGPTQQPINVEGTISTSVPSETHGAAGNVVNGSGLDMETLQHDVDQGGGGMWVTDFGGVGNAENHPLGLDCSTWIKFDFGKSYPLGLMMLWNHNQDGGQADLTDRGLRNVSIHSTNDGTYWTLVGDYEIPESPGGGPIDVSFELDFAGADANSIVITAAVTDGNWGSGYYGLSEVLFGIDGTTYDPYSNHPAEASITRDEITASASSAYDGGTVASNTINGSVERRNFRETNSGGWWHGNGSTDPTSADPNNTPEGAAWLRYDFAQPYELGTMWVWNHNQGAPGHTARGLKKVYIDYNDGINWNRLMDGANDYFILTRASGEALIKHTDAIDFGGVTATTVVITADQTDGIWGLEAGPYYGMNEVLFGIANTVWTEPVAEIVLPTEDAIHDTRIVATGSSAWGGSVVPQSTVNGAGLNWNTLLHDNNGVADTMWHASGNSDLDSATPDTTVGYEWLRYDFDKSYPLGTMWVWNHNQAGNSARGLKKVYIEYTNDGESWTKLMDGENDFFVFDQASGEPDLQYTTAIDFAGANAISVVITADSVEPTWGGAPYAGLSEVRFGILGTPYRGHPSIVEGDVDDDFDVDLDDLKILTGEWLANNIIDPIESVVLDDFESYNMTDPNITSNWSIIENPGTISLLTEPEDAHGGDQALRIVTPEKKNPSYTITKLELADPVDLANHDVLRTWIYRHETQDYDITITLFDDQDQIITGSGTILLSTGSPNNPVGQWSSIDVNLSQLTSPVMVSSITFAFGASYVDSVGTLDIDDVELVDLPDCSTAILSDLNADCKVDLFDYSIMASNWLEGTSL